MKEENFDECYLVWEDGFLVRLAHHKIGEPCLLSYNKEKEEAELYLSE